MYALIILALAVFAFYTLISGWAILSLLAIAAIGWLIKNDKHNSIDDFFAAGLLITVLGGVAAAARHLYFWVVS